MALNLKESVSDVQQLDIAIIGAGISGLYSGWRLLADIHEKSSEQAKPTIAVFEMGNRIGGRLFSVRNYPGIPNLVGELGGMRYMEHQEIANSLINKFKLKSEDFPVADDKNLIYLRGQRFHESDYGKPNFSTKYNLDERFQGIHPDKLFTKIVDEVLERNGEKPGVKDRKYWDEIKDKLIYHKGPDKGCKLMDMGFWNLLMDQVGHEGYNFLSDAGAYHSNTINWNAAEAMPYMIGDFTGDVKFKTITGGFDLIAECLAEAFIEAGGSIYIKSQLLNFKKNDNKEIPYKYQLEIRNTSNNEEQNIYCNKIILAMPRRSLELLNPDNVLFENGENTTFLHYVRSVIGEPSFKLLMAFEPGEYKKPWWYNTLGIEKGRSVTDLPMRQCYYFGTDPETKASLMLASYNDMRTVDFWKPLEPLDAGKQYLKSFKTNLLDFERYKPDETQFASIQELIAAQEKYPEGYKRIVEHSLSQLQELHGLNSIPKPFATMFANWDDDPFGGGYHAWKARYNVGEVMKYMRKPKINEEIHICGEAYSDQQGWIEGAFCVAEKMLQEEFGMAHPEWLNKDYYLGR